MNFEDDDGTPGLILQINSHLHNQLWLLVYYLLYTLQNILICIGGETVSFIRFCALGTSSSKAPLSLAPGPLLMGSAIRPWVGADLTPLAGLNWSVENSRIKTRSWS